MKLFTVGPVEMYPETLEQSGRQLPYFRTAEFSEIMLQSEQIAGYDKYGANIL